MSTIEQIAAALQGYDPKALAAARVNHFLARQVDPVTDTERVGVFAALGRVLAQDVVSPISVPPHDNSAMDGFAFDGSQLVKGQSLTLRQAEGTAFAGKAWAGVAGAGTCVKIMTGAIMPTGMDTVVPLELVKVEGDQIHIPADVLQRGDNRRFMGEDLMAGQPALRPEPVAAVGPGLGAGRPTPDPWPEWLADRRADGTAPGGLTGTAARLLPRRRRARRLIAVARRFPGHALGDRSRRA